MKTTLTAPRRDGQKNKSISKNKEPQRNQFATKEAYEKACLERLFW